MRRKRFVGAVLICIFAVSAIGSSDWATADASRVGQFTVPTFTPTPEPVTPKPPPPERASETATPVPLTVTPGTSVPPALLPVAGGDSNDGPVLLLVLGPGLLIVILALRRRAPGP